MAEPKPIWRDGVPWCSFGGCMAHNDCPGHHNGICLPAVRRLVDAAKMVLANHDNSHECPSWEYLGDGFVSCGCGMNELEAALPPVEA